MDRMGLRAPTSPRPRAGGPDLPRIDAWLLLVPDGNFQFILPPMHGGRSAALRRASAIPTSTHQEASPTCILTTPIHTPAYPIWWPRSLHCWPPPMRHHFLQPDPERIAQCSRHQARSTDTPPRSPVAQGRPPPMHPIGPNTRAIGTVPRRNMYALVRSRLADKSLVRAELLRGISAQLKGIPAARQVTILRRMLAEGTLHEFPPFLGARAKRIALQPLDPGEHVEDALRKLTHTGHSPHRPPHRAGHPAITLFPTHNPAASRGSTTNCGTTRCNGCGDHPPVRDRRLSAGRPGRADLLLAVPRSSSYRTPPTRTGRSGPDRACQDQENRAPRTRFPARSGVRSQGDAPA